MYEYKAIVKKVIDGDTVDLEFDLGFFVKIDLRTRLSGINAPEMRTMDGPAAKQFLSEMIPVGTQVLVDTQKGQEKYGRWLATITVNGTNVNQAMIANGHAVEYMV